MCRHLAVIALLALTFGCHASRERAALVPVTVSVEPVKGEALRAFALPIDAELELPEPWAGPSFQFVVHHDGPRVVLLADGDATWGSGGAELVSDGRDDGVLALRQRVATGKLPREIAMLVGGRVILSDGKVDRCTATIGAPELLYRGDPSLLFAYGADGERVPAPDAERDAAVEQVLATGTPLLTAPLRVDVGDCGGATWARASASEAAFFVGQTSTPPSAAESEREREALEAFRSLPEYRATQASYAEWRALPGAPTVPTPERWEEHHPVAHSVYTLAETRSGRELVVVLVDTYEGCGSDFGAGLWALFEVTPDGLERRLVLHDTAPKVVLDLERDGRFEALQYGALYREVGVGQVESTSLPEPYFVCGC